MAALVERAGTLAEMPRPGRFRALVVLADPGLRETVVRELIALGAVDVAQAASVDEGRVRARANGPRELTVTEVSLPDGSGIALVGELRMAGWAHGIVLSSLEDPYTVRAALSAGVRSFVVQRPVGPPARVTGASGRPLAPTPLHRRPTGVDALSAREVEVLSLVAEGRSNRDIGADLGLSALTVKSHLARISRKLGTGDRAEMVVIALRAGVID